MYACIDLGSNSFHLLIGEWNNGRIEIVERCSDKVQLGEDVRLSGKITAAAFDRGVESLRHFKSLMDTYPLERYWALGTNTFRVTENAQQFIDSTADLGIDISIISGVQEAVLVYAGVISSLPEDDSRRLVIDIGGGSTEVIVGEQHRRLLTESLSIGSVAWRDRFFLPEYEASTELERQLELASSAAKEAFSAAAPGIRKANWTEAYASSGTVKMIAAICEEHGFGDARVSISALRDLQPLVIAATLGQGDLPGLKEKRRDLLLPGWAIMSGLMEAYGVQTINFSATALREGMLDFMVRNKKTLQVMEESDLPAVSYANS
jgi:exopolyphosphatase / guanosine-5'-triphosphate,3'-diphosphate pyrophosphatase